jgi:hypothetical protein
MCINIRSSAKPRRINLKKGLSRGPFVGYEKLLSRVPLLSFLEKETKNWDGEKNEYDEAKRLDWYAKLLG